MTESMGDRFRKFGFGVAMGGALGALSGLALSITQWDGSGFFVWAAATLIFVGIVSVFIGTIAGVFVRLLSQKSGRANFGFWLSLATSILFGGIASLAMLSWGNFSQAGIGALVFAIASGLNISLGRAGGSQ